MEAIDRSQWQPQSWANPTTNHYRYQESASAAQRNWYPSLPPPLQPPTQSPQYYSDSHHGGSYPNYRSNEGGGGGGYYSASTASASPTGSHRLSPPSSTATTTQQQQQLLSHSEASNLMGFLDDFSQHSYPHAARGGDHWHQSRQVSQHHHHHHPHHSHPHPHPQQHHLHSSNTTNGTSLNPHSDFPPPLCTPPQIPTRPVQGLYPKIEYPEPELDTKDHLYHYPSPSDHSSASTAPSPPNSYLSTASRPTPTHHIPPHSHHHQAPSQRRRSHSSNESGSGTASPLDGGGSGGSGGSGSTSMMMMNRVGGLSGVVGGGIGGAGGLGGISTSPQKRMNHIMSEQRRRNAIREGYHTLIQLLAPEDGGPMIEMPTRGRPKGSSAKNRNRKRGKSGILFRAVEFTNWLEEGNDALREEVKKMEAASGLA